MTDKRTATVNRDTDDCILGASLFLGAADLAALGLDNVDELEYEIREGELKLRNPDQEVTVA